MVLVQKRAGVYAHPLRRLVAYWIDMTLLYAVLLGIQAIIFTQTEIPQWIARQHPLVIYFWIMLVISVPIWLYFTWWESSAHQATVGKRLLRLRVTHQHGARLSPRQAFRRTLAKLGFFELGHISFLFPTQIDLTAADAPPWGVFLVVILMLVYFGVVWITPRRQSIHDLLVGTVVVPVLSRAGAGEQNT